MALKKRSSSYLPLALPSMPIGAQVFKEFHLLDLLEISCAVNDRDLAYFRFRTDRTPTPSETAAAEASGVPGTAGTTLITIRDTRTNLLIKNVRESLRRMTCGIHPYFDVKVIIPPDQYVLQIHLKLV